MQEQQQEQRGQGQGSRQQSGRNRGRPGDTPAEDLSSPRHYNLDLPRGGDEEGEELQNELRRLEEQNDRIIQLLQQIKSGMNRY